MLTVPHGCRRYWRVKVVLSGRLACRTHWMCVCGRVRRELWIPANLATYRTDKMAEKQGGVLSGKQKQYLRFMRNRKPNYGFAD